MSATVKDQQTDEGSEDEPHGWKWQQKLRANPTTRVIYRVFIAVLGFAIVALGVVLLPLPGPGWVIIFIGLGVWSSEFEWASDLLSWTKDKVWGWTRWLGRQNAAVRGLVSLAIAALVLACLYGYLLWQGVPTWLPDFVETPLKKVPGL
ncbi:MAG: TIGR02611 family protein [Allobranchiibius sp.]